MLDDALIVYLAQASWHSFCWEGRKWEGGRRMLEGNEKVTMCIYISKLIGYGSLDAYYQ